MLELLFSLLLQLSVLQGGTTDSSTTSTNGKKSDTTQATKIGSGGWDEKNFTNSTAPAAGTNIGSGGWDEKN